MTSYPILSLIDRLQQIGQPVLRALGRSPTAIPQRAHLLGATSRAITGLCAAFNRGDALCALAERAGLDAFSRTQFADALDTRPGTLRPLRRSVLGQTRSAVAS